jgi:AbrB family looped-hinge helix DNA binding protein
VKITSKGQVTIPKAIRDELGFLPGTEVEFFKEDGQMVVRKRAGADRQRAEEAIAHLREAGRKYTMTTEEVMRLTRGEDWGTGHLEEGDGDPR